MGVEKRGAGVHEEPQKQAAESGLLKFGDVVSLQA